MMEIEATRARLDRELRELEGRLPATARIAKRGAAAVAGIGAVGVMSRFLMRRRKRKNGDRRYRDLEKRLDRLEQRLDDV